MTVRTDIRTTFIYLLVNQDGVPLYVGKTVNQDLRPKDHRKRFENPQFLIIDVIQPGQDWKARETFWIAYYKQWYPLANISLGGGGSITKSPETKKRMSEAQKGRTFSLETLQKMKSAERPPISEQAKKKISQALRGRAKPPRTVEHKERFRQARVGKHPSEETKLKMSLAKKGRPSPFKGKPWSSARREAQNRRIPQCV